ncbi:S-layer homology domain-containing protein [Deinococcus petrolearius]|uniref:S-layer homology domain-containing protein n=1 Tax=Deinococcus petrolearius TaxID=1751295 RepID=A0ABW1DNB0_9DEIO
MKKAVLVMVFLGGAVSAQTAAPAPAAVPNPNQVVITDVPADHWARQAVALAMSKGWITGFPDGTFRGTQPLTRYQAALIFTRVLSSDALQGATSAELQVFQAGMASVQQELALALGRIDALATLVGEQQAQLQDAAAQGQASAEQIAALRVQVDSLAAAQRGTQAQLDTAMQLLSNSVTATAPGTATPPPANLADPSRLPDARFTVSNTIPAAGSTSRILAGGGVAYSTSGGVQALVAADYPFSDRLSATFRGTLAPKTSSGSLALGAQYRFAGRSDFTPSLGLSAGAAFSRASTADTAAGVGSGLFVQALAGVDYRMASTITLFAEAGLRYSLSNNGSGTGPGAGSGGVTPVFHGGLKFNF